MEIYVSDTDEVTEVFMLLISSIYFQNFAGHLRDSKWSIGIIESLNLKQACTLLEI